MRQRLRAIRALSRFASLPLLGLLVLDMMAGSLSRIGRELGVTEGRLSVDLSRPSGQVVELPPRSGVSEGLDDHPGASAENQ